MATSKPGSLSADLDLVFAVKNVPAKQQLRWVWIVLDLHRQVGEGEKPR
jgi:hypothetical protein